MSSNFRWVPACDWTLGYWKTRGYANSQITNSQTGRLADWTSHGLDNSPICINHAPATLAAPASV